MAVLSKESGEEYKKLVRMMIRNHIRFEPRSGKNIPLWDGVVGA